MLSGAAAYLDSFVNLELSLASLPRDSFKLERLRALLASLGNPERQLRCLHVAGSKGKGSTCVMAATMLACAGYRVGLYTSPHLHDYKERLRILSPQDFCSHDPKEFAGMISERALTRLIQEIEPHLESFRTHRKFGRLTYFEVMTAIAFYFFFRRRVDFAVLEVGLGGRLDATNVISALVCAITPISLEHTQILGKTLSKIAREKAGIIKSSHSAVVLAQQRPAALKVLRQHCTALGIKPVEVGKDLTIKGVRPSSLETGFLLHSKRGANGRWRLPFVGEHQVQNAAVAIGMLNELRKKGFVISEQAMRRGLKLTRWPGRFEIASRKPVWILDGAHNPESTELLVRTFRRVFSRFKVVLIWGVSEDKDRAGMARQLRKISRVVIATRARHPRAHTFSVAELAQWFSGQEIILEPDVARAVALAQQSVGPQEIVLVTGSLFVVGEVRKLCINTKV